MLRNFKPIHSTLSIYPALTGSKSPIGEGFYSAGDEAPH
ncbi:hypothetical protein EMIT079MI2_250027 [Bacillus sp. IT-79MI2]